MNIFSSFLSAVGGMEGKMYSRSSKSESCAPGRGLGGAG